MKKRKENVLRNKFILHNQGLKRQLFFNKKFEVWTAGDLLEFRGFLRIPRTP